TGPYHETVAYTLHEGGARVIVANPKRARDYAKGLGLLTKTDAGDARALVYYGANERIQQKLTSWQPPSVQIRALAALLARLEAVEKDLRRERNRLEKTQAGAIAAPEAVLDSLPHSIKALEAERARLKREIEAHYDRHPDLREDRELLKSIPAVGDATGNQMLRVLGAPEFASARQAAAFCNLVPRQHESGSSVRAPARMPKGAPRLRAVLYMAAVVAIQHNPELKRFYERLCQRGKAKMSAIGAVMRKLIHIAYGVLKHRTPYAPSLVTTA
ncbi:MAG: IS110 family transposase, partial [Gammaproteobacteria bacterium]